MRSAFRLVTLGAFGLAIGCAARARPVVPAAPDVVVVAESAAPAPPVSEAPAAPAPPPPPEDLPPIWTERRTADVRFADQLAVARALRARFATMPARGADAGAQGRTTFEATQAVVDQTSTAYARAARAQDADDDGRVTAMSEAAEVMLAWAQSLDALGLATLPPAWRTDGALRVSFEDIAYGPAKRWRAEGAALARQCARVASNAGVDSAAAAECRRLDARMARLVKPARSDAGTACACDPLDPLCSSSLGPWCARSP